MEIKQVGSQPSGKGRSPVARTAWHTHPRPGHQRRVRGRKQGIGLRLGAARRRRGRGDSSGRRGLVCAWREAPS